MTINTQVHHDNGTKSTNTICEEKTKKIIQKTKEHNSGAARKAQVVRRELIALTKHLKELQKALASNAISDTEAAAILSKKPNNLLTEHYLRATGATN